MLTFCSTQLINFLNLQQSMFWTASVNICFNLKAFKGSSSIKTCTYFSGSGPALSACPGTSTWMKHERSLISDIDGLLTKSWNDASLSWAKSKKNRTKCQWRSNEVPINEIIKMNLSSTHDCILNHGQWERLHVSLVASNRPVVVSVSVNEKKRKEKTKRNWLKKILSRTKRCQNERKNNIFCLFPKREIEHTNKGKKERRT